MFKRSNFMIKLKLYQLYILMKFKLYFISIVMFYLQDLQSEIESHRVVYDRLDNTGRKLLGSLTSQEDAVMLQRRLDEMNQRWNHLKSKSIAIRYSIIIHLYEYLHSKLHLFRRNRLESNSEHWNALLLSLRELTEWVIRKDTELTSLGLGPMKGDAASLQKQMVNRC